MKVIEDIGLGEIVFINFGKTIRVEIISTYDGHTLGFINLNEINSLSLKNADSEYEIFGTYIPLIEIDDINESAQKKISFLSGELSLLVECNSISMESSELIEKIV